jgi:hypothetical protein
MNLLRINDQLLNVDLIQTVKIRDNEITLYLLDLEILFHGEEALALKQWLLNNARDLSTQKMTQSLEPAGFSAGDGAASSGVQLFKMPLP